MPKPRVNFPQADFRPASGPLQRFGRYTAMWNFKKAGCICCALSIGDKIAPVKRRSYTEIADDLLTLKRILEQQKHPLFTQLTSLWLDVRKLPDAWTFPAEENGVSGFAGLGPIFVIAEQPSTSEWPPEDKGRRLLYDALRACDAEQVHLTDIVKTRGKGHEWRQWPAERLRRHIDLLRQELNELKPQKLVLLGTDARRLFSTHFPKEAASAKMIPHFGYLRRVPLEDRDRWREFFCKELLSALNS